MADKKISQLSSASTPVAGTEVLPIVQSAATVKVSIDNLTKGRTVNALSFDTDVAAAGVTLSGTTLAADGTDANININITPKGTGEVAMAKVNIDGGAIDGTAIGANSASSGAFTTVSATTPIGVASGGTGLSSGTSGGVLAFTASGTLASSNALAANALVIGGGAGAAPSTTTTGTGVLTALGVNTGTAGAFVVNGGALGTPSSGTVTNLTGTASININGTVGASTPNTGAFTTLSASSTVSGTGFSTYLASPPAIGGTTPAAGTFTTLTSAADNNIAISGEFIRTKSATVVGQAAATTFFTVAVGNFTNRALKLGVLSRLSSGDGGSRVWYRESVFVETGGAALTESNITNITGANGTLAFSVSGTTISVTMYSNATAGVNETCEMALEILSRSPGTITTN